MTSLRSAASRSKHNMKSLRSAKCVFPWIVVSYGWLFPISGSSEHELLLLLLLLPSMM